MAQKDQALHLARMWGWENPTDEIIEMAATSLRYQKMSLGKIVTDMGIITEEEKEKLLKSKPKNILTLDWLSRHVSGLQNNPNLTEKILALHNGFPYFDDLEILIVHHYVRAHKEVFSECDRLDAILMLIEREKPILVFSSYNQLRDYRQKGRAAKIDDPILNRLSVNNETLEFFALADFKQIAQLQYSNAPSEGHVAQNEDIINDDVWYTHQTKNDSTLRKFAKILDEAMMNKVSDISVEPRRDGSSFILYRQFRDLIPPLSTHMLDPIETEEITRFLISKARANQSASRLREPADGQFIYQSSIGEVFIRASFIPIDRGRTDIETISVSLRLLPRVSTGHIYLEELNMEPKVIEEIDNVIAFSQGMVVLAGPTNSGKSTTIAGMINKHVTRYGNRFKRLSIEDPVERFLPNILQISLPQHKKNFAEIMKAILRHDPDMIWIGEIRDIETAKTCIRAATSGHLVLTTIHASDTILAWKTLGNMLERHMQMDLTESLSMIVSQRLLKSVCDKCFKGYRSPTDDEKRKFEYYCRLFDVEYDIPEQVVVKNEKGCAACRGGYNNVLPINEVLPVSRELKGILSRDVKYDEVAKYKSTTLFESAINLLKQGKVEMESVFMSATPS